jgi:hypothetical protein
MFMVCSNIKLTFPAKSIAPPAYIFVSNPKGIWNSGLLPALSLLSRQTFPAAKQKRHGYSVP